MIPRCVWCGTAIGWTRLIRGHDLCEACVLTAARRKEGEVANHGPADPEDDNKIRRNVR